MNASEPPVVEPCLVLVASTVDAVPAEVPWPQDLVSARFAVWCGAARETGASAPPWVGSECLHELGVSRASGVGGAPRAAAARLRSGVLARRAGVPADYLWALKTDRGFARAVRAADVMLSLDEASDAALRVSPDLAGGALVLESSHAASTGLAWVSLQHWRDLVDASAGADRAALESAVELQSEEGGPRPPPPALLGGLLRHIELAGGRATDELPRPEAGRVLAALRAVLQRLDQPDPFAAAQTYLDLWEGAACPSEGELVDLVTRTAACADDALADADFGLAMHRLRDALWVALHRARHGEALSSPLVDDPSAVLKPIWASATYARLRDDSVARPALTPQRRNPAVVGPFMPRVVVLPGAYGAFHGDLLAALDGRADVRVPNLLRHRWLRRRMLSAQSLLLLDAVRRGEVDVLGQLWDGAPAGVDPSAQLAALRALALSLRRADVVVGEWFDIGTMCASHLVPDGTRMVVRAHGLDILDPWVHLVDWRGIDEVMATTPALCSLLRDLTSRAGAPSPTQVLPYRPDLAGPPPVRDPQTRFTIGMVGWGRQVKEPHFALDLLERDPRRRLVLIGAAFPERGPGMNQPYADSFRERLRDPTLAARVDIVGPTNDVPFHLARVGIILSASRREGWHLGLIEGAASGAVPVVRNWPMLASREGARSTHPAEWVVDDVDEADRRIAELADPHMWAAASERARIITLQRYAPGPIAAAYRALILTAHP